MKKLFYSSLLVLFATVFLFNGCSKKNEEKVPVENTSTTSSEVSKPEEAIVETRVGEDLKTVLDSYEFDIDGDGTEEKIELMTSAERDSDGLMLWDDGQEWKLTVKKTETEFVLFDGRIQIGMLNHQIFEVDGKLHIIYTLNATAQLEFVHFEFDADRRAFIKKNEYVNNQGNINVLHHTMNTFDK